ncbi:MAG: hypothetical protein JST80_11540 [Bdellovibrionales bacterium]|nr:hypothetical protein [Bdellovibrionales bacterium]
MMCIILCGIVLQFTAACVPKKNSSGSDSSTGSSTTNNSPLFSLNSFKVGGNSPMSDASGVYYSKYDPVTITGACRGGVSEVYVELTPQSSSTTAETVNCSGNVYTWTKSFSTQTSYTITLTPRDGGGTPVNGLAPITKHYVYDTTAPAAPTFLTPTTSTTYSVSDGTTNFTITGQVLTDVTTLLGPGNTLLTLTANADAIHQDFSYAATVPVGSSIVFDFIAVDQSGNVSASAMTITNLMSTMVPMAYRTSGGSIDVGGLTIQSSVGFTNGIMQNSNVELITGAAGIVGSNP